MFQKHIVVTRDRTTGRLQSHNTLMRRTCDFIRKDGRTVTAIAQAARVSPGTLYAWMRGDIFFGRLDTMGKVLNVMGKSLDIVDLDDKTHH